MTMKNNYKRPEIAITKINRVALMAGSPERAVTNEGDAVNMGGVQTGNAANAASRGRTLWGDDED